LGFWLASWGGGEPNWWVWRIPVAIAAFVTAEVFYRVVEGPAHRLSRRLRRRVAQREIRGR
jgi:peptidoglycan/LPS O-acetylase OafA/YrhL